MKSLKLIGLMAALFLVKISTAQMVVHIHNETNLSIVYGVSSYDGVDCNGTDGASNTVAPNTVTPVTLNNANPSDQIRNAAGVEYNIWSNIGEWWDPNCNASGSSSTANGFRVEVIGPDVFFRP